ncbi:MAG: hypothetical protein H7Y61_03985, partial [Rhizobiales bacterium]|nr:hypothetical protein [Rhizobacter sp.]
PLDPLDFEARPGVRGAAWPIAHDEVAAHYPRACRYADCGDASFRLAEAWGGRPAAPIAEGFVDAEVRSDHLERWCAVPALVERLGPMIDSEPRIRTRIGQTCIGLELRDGGRTVAGVRLVYTLSGAAVAEPLRADAVVLACGGVESTRLLLHFAHASTPLRVEGRAFLGVGYMGHLSGKIASIQLAGDAAKTIYDFERIGGRYLRRRFVLSESALRELGLLNIAMWLDNPPPADPAHGSGILSAAYLGMRMPVIGRRLAPNAIRQSLLRRASAGGLAPHIANVVRSLPSTLAFVTRFIRSRYFSTPRRPGFFAHSPSNLYALHFHAEQTPNDDSRIELDTARDALGVPRARLSLRFSRRDAESIVAAHAALDRHLRSHGIGELRYWYPPAERVDAVLHQARDGFHQLGGTRMAAGPEAGVTDCEGRVFGTNNLYVCSSALFPTSGQANPTLTILALAIRQAAHLAATVGAVAEPA